MDRVTLGRALKEIADKKWERKKQPVLLSALPRLLQEDFPSESPSKIPNGSFKLFIKATGDEFGYKLIEHPTQKAKVGLIPDSANFDFETVETLVSSAAAIAPGDGDAFVAILAKLSEQELQSITIPASVLVKLFGKK